MLCTLRTIIVLADCSAIATLKSLEIRNQAREWARESHRIAIQARLNLRTKVLHV